ncbi:MAG TPA: gliding motility-associated C-terminal domain-containing protein, partial [Flavobacteriales bacterium]
RSITLSAPGGLSISAVAAVYPNHLHLTCHDSNDGMIDLTITGGTHPYQILWTGPDGGTANTEDIHGLPAGDFTVVVTDANGCSVSTLITLKAPLELLATVTAAQFGGGYGISCANGSNGSITTTVSGGTSPYTYAWSGPNGFVAQTANIGSLPAGTYMLTITDASGCTLQRQVVLTAPQPLMVGATLSDAGFGFEVGCTGTDGSIDLSVSGGQPAYQYDWSGPNGYASQQQDPSDLIAGGYQVSVVDANGCMAQRSYELTGPDAFTTAVQVISNECDGTDDGQVLLDVQGGIQPYTYAWSGPNGFAANTEDIGPLASGIYNVTITDAGGCSIDTVADIIAAAPILWDLYASQYGEVNIQCHGANTGVIGLTVQGGFQPLQIDWSGPNGYNFNGSELTALYAGSYQLTVTDDHGCQRDTTVVLVEPAQPLNASLLAAVQASGTNISCHGGSDGTIEAIVTGGTAPYTFDWRVGGVGFSTTQDISGLTTGVYELVITDTNACQVTLDITLTEPDSALHVAGTITDMNGANTSCAGATDGGITVVLSGGSPAYTMDWTGPNGFISTNDTLAGLAAGDYVLNLTDLNGCVLEQTFSVIAPEPLVLSLDALVQPSGDHISCAGLNDGRIEAQITGGIGTYQPTWSGPDGFTSNALVVDQLAPGLYCLEVIDANGCTAEACVTLTEPTTLQVSAEATGATCGSPNGSVDATAAGGSQPFNTAWSSGQSTEDLVGVPQGTYALVVTDINGCMDSVTVVVSGTPGIGVDHTTTTPLCQASNEGAIDLTVVQGTAPFQFSWSDGPTSEDRTDLTGGIYGVLVTDDAGCTWTLDLVVEAPEALTADSTVSLYANGYEVSTYGGNDGSIAVEPQGGTAPYNALWSTGATTLDVQGLPAGAYAVTLTDANGCTLSMDFLLENPTDIRVPTGFTPNGDGQNDAFVIQGIEGYPENQFTVLNRWGNVVYERLNYANDWRGENHEGGELANGTYFVVVRLGRTGTVIQNYVDLRR